MKYTMDEFKEGSSRLANTIKATGIQYHYIYAVPRGGLVLAMTLSSLIDVSVAESSPSSLNKLSGFNYLIVDDIIDSGDTRNRYEDFDFACLHQKKRAIINTKEAVLTYAAHQSVESDWIHYWWEGDEKPAEDAVIRMIQAIGEDGKREGLKETPARVSKSYEHLFSGYKKDPQEEITTFDNEGVNQLILLKDIEFYSMCEHHMLPFIGKAHIAYIPDKKIIGISKLARILEIYSRRLQIQERIGMEVTTALMNLLTPKGAACIIEADHLCMRMRGVEKQNSKMVTSSLKGDFMDDNRTRQELMELIR